MSEPAAEWVPIESLHAWEGNPRKNADAVAGVAKSIRRFGFGAPIVARKGGEIVAGHTRWKAAHMLGLERVPVRFVDLDPAEAHLYAIADNRLGEVAEWDPRGLADALAEYPAVDLHVTGFDKRELDRLLATFGSGEPPDAEPQITRAEELRAEWATDVGQLWALGEHRLLCGDSRNHADVSRLLGDDRVDLVATDPPYGVSYIGKTSDALPVHNDAPEQLDGIIDGSFTLAMRACRPGACWYVTAPAGPSHLAFSGWMHRHEILRQGLVWVKQTLVMGRSDYHYQHELILYGWVPGAAHQRPPDRKQSTVWEVDRPTRSAEHPTIKPVALIARMVANSSNPGDVVYDPFFGSGTCALACEQHGRRARGIEVAPEYVAVALQRYLDATGRRPERLQ